MTLNLCENMKLKKMKFHTNAECQALCEISVTQFILKAKF